MTIGKGRTPGVGACGLLRVCCVVGRVSHADGRADRRTGWMGDADDVQARTDGQALYAPTRLRVWST